MCVGLWACARVICACEVSDSLFEKLQSVVRKPVYRFWNAVPSSNMMCLQAVLLPSSLLFGLAPQSLWSLLAVQPNASSATQRVAF